MFRAAADAQPHTIAYARISCHDRKDDLEPRDLKRLRATVMDGEVGRPVTPPRTGGPEAGSRPPLRSRAPLFTIGPGPLSPLSLAPQNASSNPPKNTGLVSRKAREQDGGR